MINGVFDGRLIERSRELCVELPDSLIAMDVLILIGFETLRRP